MHSPTLIAFNKPFGVVSQFSGSGARPTLAAFIDVPGVYPAGRLDADSEGLLLLTDDGGWQARIASPRFKLEKTYWAEVEGEPPSSALEPLRRGIDLGDFVTRPARARTMDCPPSLWPRHPPVRFRAAIPTSWLEIRLCEGKNRQVRRMTAKLGYPTLRLIRMAIGDCRLSELGLQPGEWRRISLLELGGPFSRSAR